MAQQKQNSYKMTTVNEVEKTKPRKSNDRAPELLNPLNDRGKELEKLYAQTLKSLKAEVASELPAIDAAKKQDLVKALREVKAAEDNLKSKRHAWNGAIRNKASDARRDQKLLDEIPAKLAAAQRMLKCAQALQDGDEVKALAIEDANKQLAKCSDPKTVERLKEKVGKNQFFLEQGKKREPQILQEIELAEKAVAEAKANAYRQLGALGVDGLLGSDRFDGKLAAYLVIAEATPTDLARYAQQGPEQEKRIMDFLKNRELMVRMLVADSPYWEKFGPALEIYEAIQKASPRAKEGLLERLALAVAMEHAVPILLNLKEDSGAGQDQFADPVARYLSYEKAFLNGELDPGFKDLSVWDLRMVVDGNEPDEIADWGRRMLRSYRPDIATLDNYAWRYVMSVNTEINYTSTFQKLGWDDPELNNYQNILANGGICGRRAFFGRFILRAFGIPTTARPQKGHAALVHWTPDGWVPCLGGGWGCSNGRIFERYANDLDFLASSQARQNPQAFLRVKRAQWLGDLLGEPRAYGNTLETPEFWYSLAILEQARIIDGLKAKQLDAVGEDLGEAEDSSLGNKGGRAASPTDREITVDAKGVITIPAAACTRPTTSTEAILFMPSNLGGAQLHYSRYGGAETFAYAIDAPKAGKYKLTARLVTPAPRQHLYLSVNGAEEMDIKLPYTIGLWGELDPVEIELKQGKNELSFGRGHYFMRGVTIRDFTLEPVR